MNIGIDIAKLKMDYIGNKCNCDNKMSVKEKKAYKSAVCKLYEQLKDTRRQLDEVMELRQKFEDDMMKHEDQLKFWESYEIED